MPSRHQLRIARACSFILLPAMCLLPACEEGPAGPTPVATVEPPPEAETAVFRVVLEPDDPAAEATYSWFPEPVEGQGSPAAEFDVATLESIQVEVEVCGAFYGDALDVNGAATAGPPMSASFAAANQQEADADDFRTLVLNQMLSGRIDPGNDIDVYYFNGPVGQQVSFRMNRVNGSLDPYLGLYDPSGRRIAFNDNGGGGVDALINGIVLPQTGRYTLYAYDRRYARIGDYTIVARPGAEALNPLPAISYLSPSSAGGTLFGNDFWVEIRGSSFTPQTEVFWNGSPRGRFYSSPNLMYIRVRGSDLSSPWPRNVFINVRNPAPGGGPSNSQVFPIHFPFLGETVLESPEHNGAVAVDEAVAFRVRWTHPSDSWRVMDYMELRIVDVGGDILARVRVTEGQGESSTLGLHDADGTLADEGLPGEARSITNGVVTLDLESGTIAGSGSEVTAEATLSFGSGAVGTHRLEFGIIPKQGEAQEDDLLGTLHVVPAHCASRVTGVSIVPLG